MATTVEEIGAKMDALGLWEAIVPYNWALRPCGHAVPYFCSVLKDANPKVRVRFLLLEGWQTFHDFVRTRVDHAYGFYSTPMEFAHYELLVCANAGARLYRHDPGYVPQEVRGGEAEALCCKLLWEAYGVMLRIESDRSLALQFADEKAMFSRLEGADGKWTDAPLVIPSPRPHVEHVSLEKELVRRAKDLPIVRERVLEVDFRLCPGVITREARPRCAYRFVALEPTTGERALDLTRSVEREGGLRGLWESLAQLLLKSFVERGQVPGEVKVVSPRTFRMLRPLCLELPFKLSLHDRLERLEAAFRAE